MKSLKEIMNFFNYYHHFSLCFCCLWMLLDDIVVCGWERACKALAPWWEWMESIWPSWYWQTMSHSKHRTVQSWHEHTRSIKLPQTWSSGNIPSISVSLMNTTAVIKMKVIKGKIYFNEGVERYWAINDILSRNIYIYIHMYLPTYLPYLFIYTHKHTHIHTQINIYRYI